MSKFPSLKDGDVRSVGMGQPGEDILLSPYARDVIGDVSFECKNTERINVFAALEQCLANCPHSTTQPVVVFHRNRSDTYATVRFAYLLDLLFQAKMPTSDEASRCDANGPPPSPDVEDRSVSLSLQQSIALCDSLRTQLTHALALSET